MTKGAQQHGDDPASAHAQDQWLRHRVLCAGRTVSRDTGPLRCPNPFGFPTLVLVGSVFGVIGLRQILDRSQKGLALPLISLAFTLLWVCWGVMELSV